MEEEPEPVRNPRRKADYRLPKMYTMTPRQYYNDCEILCTKRECIAANAPLPLHAQFWILPRQQPPPSKKLRAPCPCVCVCGDQIDEINSRRHNATRLT
jgi:hypothetical protein